jgi:hypothetical protein
MANQADRRRIAVHTVWNGEDIRNGQSFARRIHPRRLSAALPLKRQSCFSPFCPSIL